MESQDRIANALWTLRCKSNRFLGSKNRRITNRLNSGQSLLHDFLNLKHQHENASSPQRFLCRIEALAGHSSNTNFRGSNKPYLSGATFSSIFDEVLRICFWSGVSMTWSSSYTWWLQGHSLVLLMSITSNFQFRHCLLKCSTQSFGRMIPNERRLKSRKWNEVKTMRSKCFNWRRLFVFWPRFQFMSQKYWESMANMHVQGFIRKPMILQKQQNAKKGQN